MKWKFSRMVVVLVATVVVVLSAAHASAKTVCSIGPAVNSGTNNVWGPSSGCQCGTGVNISIKGNAAGARNGNIIWLQASATQTNGNANEVWVQTLETFLGGGGTAWVYHGYDTLPPWGSNIFQWGGTPDMQFLSPYKVRSVCAN